MSRFQVFIRLWPLVALLVTARSATALDDIFSIGAFSLDVSGMIDGRMIVSGKTPSWQDGSLGKVRYGGTTGGERRYLARAEGALVIEPKFGFDWSGRIVLSANDQQRMAIDLSEAFLQYKPAPAEAVGFKLKAGAFFPPISLENTGLAWTSPYTITSSAINSWVGEELRTIGSEAGFFHRGEDLEIGVTGAVFMANDPAGALLAWRGWTLNDRETGFFDRVPLAKLRITRRNGRMFRQAPSEKPFHEVDDRAGYYTSLTMDHADYGKFTALWYNTRAGERKVVNGQWAWRTKFWNLGYQTTLPGEVDLITQYMTGKTSAISFPAPTVAIVNVRYWSAFALASKEWDRNRLSLRAEHFEASDRDNSADNNNENGMAVTLAYVYRPAANQRLTVELLHVNSRRPERAFLGLAVRARENQAQASYRFFF